MSGRHKFSELTKKFTAEERREIEATKAEMRLTIEAEAAKSAPPSSHGEKVDTKSDESVKTN